MVRHQDAADLMLEGVIVSSRAAWTRGAGQLREAPLKPGDFAVSERVGVLMSDVETRLHAQAADAMTAADVPSRSRAYTTLLTTCAECHTRHATLWPQGLRCWPPELRTRAGLSEKTTAKELLRTLAGMIVVIVVT